MFVVKCKGKTASPATCELAVLFSRQILKAHRFFFHFNIQIFIFLFKYETIETHAHTFLTLIILGIATVVSIKGVRYFVGVFYPARLTAFSFYVSVSFCIFLRCMLNTACYESRI